ncbi:histidine--tRNA ligase [Oceanivirga salmonicida]|uniref:histidine--tRNA ligase n=1 Tax=Oceanivirga salmonicida TaxID=1769291 RepID=UPI000833C90E|nr:histidine--tRNA ligase [Oceanivirga salmonicida]
MQILKGMKDRYFDEIEKFDFIISKAVNTCEKYGYSRVSTPLLEELDLFKRTAGDESDVVSKEMYDFLDKGNRHIALRPEGTASIVRAYLEAKLYKSMSNTKWYYYGPMYRYEAPQKGRYREFNQFGIECFGIRNPMQDAEIIRMACDFLESIGLNDLVVEVNSLGNKQTIINYTKELQKYLLENFDKLSENSKIRANKNPLRVLDSKEDDEIVKNAPKLHDYFDDESREFFENLLKNLEKFNIKYMVNDKLVRGLDYYSDTVFEIKSSKLGAQSTVLAGGRYDRLLDQLSGQKIPAIGFAAGIERLSLILDEKLIETKKRTKIYIVYFDETKDKLFEVLDILRKNNIQIEYEYEPKGFGTQMKKANKFGADKVIILGTDEVEKNMLSIKDFNTGEQKEISFENLKEVK